MKNTLLKLPLALLISTCLTIILIGLYKQSNFIESGIDSFEDSTKSKLEFYSQQVDLNCQLQKKLTSLMYSNDFYQLDNPVVSYRKLGDVLKQIYEQSAKINSNSAEAKKLVKELQLTLQNGINASYELAAMTSGSKSGVYKDNLIESVQYYNFFTLLSYDILVPEKRRTRFDQLVEELENTSRKIVGFERLTSTVQEDLTQEINGTVIRLGRTYHESINSILTGRKKKEAGLVRLQASIKTALGYTKGKTETCRSIRLSQFLHDLQLESSYRKAVQLD